MNFTTIILAGGQSTRMGENKALVPFMGKPLIQYSIDLARTFTNDIFISSNNHDLDYLQFPVIQDIFKVKAPLAGIHAGLTASHSDWNLILTCDMPNITKELIDRLYSALDEELRMVVPHHNGFIEPLCGFYHKSLIPFIEGNLIAGKYALIDLPDSVPHRFITMADVLPEEIALLFTNVNEKKDLPG